MRESIKMLVKIFSETMPIKGTVYEFGSLQVPGQEGFSDLRPYFPDNEYIGCDIQEGTGVDCILNLHDIKLPSESAGIVLILDTFEHVEYPRKAIKEVHRILKPDGILLISSVMNFPIHEYPHDFWRFTPQGFESLLNDFNDKYVDFVGNDEFPHTIIGMASKTPFPDEFYSEFKNNVEEWKKQHYNEDITFIQSIKIGKSLIAQGIKSPHKIMPFIKENYLTKNEK